MNWSRSSSFAIRAIRHAALDPDDDGRRYAPDQAAGDVSDTARRERDDDFDRVARIILGLGVDDAAMCAMRTDRWKYIYYHGIWDRDSLHDLQTDPLERHNLIAVPAFQEQAAKLKTKLFDELEKSGALNVPLPRPAGEPLHDRKLPR